MAGSAWDWTHWNMRAERSMSVWSALLVVSRHSPPRSRNRSRRPPEPPPIRTNAEGARMPRRTIQFACVLSLGLATSCGSAHPDPPPVIPPGQQGMRVPEASQEVVVEIRASAEQAGATATVRVNGAFAGAAVIAASGRARVTVRATPGALITVDLTRIGYGAERAAITFSGDAVVEVALDGSWPRVSWRSSQ